MIYHRAMALVTITLTLIFALTYVNTSDPFWALFAILQAIFSAEHSIMAEIKERSSNCAN